MPVTTAEIVQYSDVSTPVKELYTEVRYALRWEFRPFQTIWIPSHDDVIPLLPAGAVTTKARIAEGPMPNHSRSAGFETGKSPINTPSYKVVDVDDTLNQHISDKNVNGVGSLNSQISEFEFAKNDSAFWGKEPKYTGLITDHARHLNVVELSTADINRHLDNEIFDPLTWSLASGITDTQNTIPTTLSPLQIPSYQATMAFGPAALAHPNETGGYIRLSTGEIVFYERFEDVSGIATFTGCVREQLGTVAGAIAVPAETENHNKPRIEEWIVINEKATDVAKALVDGATEDGRVFPQHWRSDNQNTSWLDPVSMAKYATAFPVMFQNPGKQKLRDFLEKEILRLMGAVLVIDGHGKLNWTPRQLPTDAAAGQIVFDKTNCVTTNEMTLRHIKKGIYSSIKFLYDWNSQANVFLSPITYRDIESENHNQIKRTKTFEFKGLHAGIHAGTQLRKLAATYGDDYFYEKLGFTIESFVNDVPLGTLVTAIFDDVKDDANGALTHLERTMMVIKATENRVTRNTVYELSGTLQRQSTRQASQNQNNIEPAEIRRGKINIATLAGITITNGIATGNITLEMGRHYYYVDPTESGTGLEFADSLNVTVSGTGPSLGIHVFGPFINKTDIDLTGKSNHTGGTGQTATQPSTAGQSGYAISTRGGSGYVASSIYSTSLSSNVTLYNYRGFEVTGLPVSAGQSTKGLYASAPDPSIDLNDGVLSGYPADLGGTGGSGGLATWLDDTGRRPISFSDWELNGRDNIADNPSTVRADGSDGGDGGGGLVIVSWGGGLVGNGKFTLDGSPAQAANSFVDKNGNTHFAGRGSGGGPGSLLWIVDGNHARPLITSANVSARHGDGNVTAESISWRNKKFASGETYKGATDATPVTNLFGSVVRIAYVPEPESTQPRATGFGAIFEDDADGIKDLRIYESALPSDANPGDLAISKALADGTTQQPTMHEFNATTGWQPFSWTGPTKDLGRVLLDTYRSVGATRIIVGLESPPRKSSLYWDPNTGQIMYVNSEGVVSEFVKRPHDVGETILRDPYMIQYGQGFKTWFPSQQRYALPSLAPVRPGDSAGSGTTDPIFDLNPPASFRSENVGATQAEIYWGFPFDAAGVTGYELRQNGVLIETFSAVVGYKLLTGLAADTRYDYNIRSVGANNTRSADVPHTINTTTNAAAPTIVSVTVSGGYQEATGTPVTLQPVTNANFAIYSATTGEVTWTKPVDLSNIVGYEVTRNGTVVSTADASSYYFGTLLPSTLYTIVITSISAGGERSTTVTVQGTTPAEVVVVPYSISVTSASGGTVTGTTTSPSNAYQGRGAWISNPPANTVGLASTNVDASGNWTANMGASPSGSYNAYIALADNSNPSNVTFDYTQ